MDKSSLKTAQLSRHVGIFFICVVLLSGCQNQNTATATIDGKVFYLETARTAGQKAKGLSGRNFLASHSGMIFLYDQPQTLSFWMKDTLIPLQIIFVNGCEIVDIQKMSVEPNPSNPQKTYVSKYPADKAIEVNMNFVPENIVGQKIDELCYQSTD